MDIKFTWKDETDIGYYECVVSDETGQLGRIYFWDYTNAHQVEQANKNRWHRDYAYEVGYCCGYSMHRGFDPSEDDDAYAYVGKPRHTIDDIKYWCENYIASGFINEYNNIVKRLDTAKARAEQLLKMGYAADVDEDF